MTMKITVKFFGPAQSWAQTQEMPLYLQQPVTLRELKTQLADMFVRMRDRMDQTALSLNAEITDDLAKVKDGDEVAVLPPICGGADTSSMLTDKPLDAGKMIQDACRATVGAVASFVGVARADETIENGKIKKVGSLFYEAYAPMAEKALGRIAQELCRQYALETLVLAHRVGEVRAGEPSVVIIAAAAHRKSALDAVSEAIERVKKEAPLWKQEKYEDGTLCWKEGISIEKKENAL